MTRRGMAVVCATPAAFLLVVVSACGGNASTPQKPSDTAPQATPTPAAAPLQEAKAIDIDLSDLGPGYRVVADAVDVGGIGWKRHYIGSAATTFEIVNSLTDVDPSAAAAALGESLLVSQMIGSGGKRVVLPPGLPPNAQAVQFTSSGLVGVQVVWTEQNLFCVLTVVPGPKRPSLEQVVALASIQDRKALAALAG